MRLSFAVAVSLAALACRPDAVPASALHADPGRVDLAAARIVEEHVESPVVVANVGTACILVEEVVASGDEVDRFEVRAPSQPSVVSAGNVFEFAVVPLDLPWPSGLADAEITIAGQAGRAIPGGCLESDPAGEVLSVTIPVVISTPAICDQDGDGALIPECGGEDCDDTDPNVHPDADEVCNEVDDDCDGAVDGPDSIDAADWYADTDADGFGDAATVTRACALPEGHTADDTDCDDTNAGIFPGAAEQCDGLDQDCDLDIDEGFGRFDFHADTDADGFGDPDVVVRGCMQPPGTAANSADCDDAQATIHPGAAEVCDGADQDCDGTPDDNAIDAKRWWLDADGDQAGNPNVWVQACVKPPGYAGNPLDCNDNSAAVHPNRDEHCDGIDENCDNQIDNDPVDGDPYYPDTDFDGFGDDAAEVMACSQPTGLIPTGGDCDDGDPAVNPDATETCNAVDQDCDSLIDDGPGVCPCPVEHQGDHAYAFCDTPAPWLYASVVGCGVFGYDLVKIESAVEDDWVTATALSYNTNPWWMGLNDRAIDGTWQWADGSSASYFGWAPGRPTTAAGNNADCVQIGATGWVDSPCFNSRRFVCEAGP